MLCRARLCCGKSIVRLSVCNVSIHWSYSFEFFKTNYTQIIVGSSLPHDTEVWVFCTSSARTTSHLLDLPYGRHRRSAILDSKLSCGPHISQLVSRCFLQLRRIKSCVQALSMDVRKTVVNNFVISRVDYCNSLLAGVPRYQSVMTLRWHCKRKSLNYFYSVFSARQHVACMLSARRATCYRPSVRPSVRHTGVSYNKKAQLSLTNPRSRARENLFAKYP